MTTYGSLWFIYVLLYATFFLQRCKFLKSCECSLCWFRLFRLHWFRDTSVARYPSACLRILDFSIRSILEFDGIPLIRPFRVSCGELVASPSWFWRKGDVVIIASGGMRHGRDALDAATGLIWWSHRTWKLVILLVRTYNRSSKNTSTGVELSHSERYWCLLFGFVDPRLKLELMCLAYKIITQSL